MTWYNLQEGILSEFVEAMSYAVIELPKSIAASRKAVRESERWKTQSLRPEWRARELARCRAYYHRVRKHLPHKSKRAPPKDIASDTL